MEGAVRVKEFGGWQKGRDDTITRQLRYVPDDTEDMCKWGGGGGFISPCDVIWHHQATMSRRKYRDRQGKFGVNKGTGMDTFGYDILSPSLT